jgi:hypothetical protein
MQSNSLTPVLEKGNIINNKIFFEGVSFVNGKKLQRKRDKIQRNIDQELNESIN